MIAPTLVGIQLGIAVLIQDDLLVVAGQSEQVE